MVEAFDRLPKIKWKKKVSVSNPSSYAGQMHSEDKQTKTSEFGVEKILLVEETWPCLHHAGWPGHKVFKSKKVRRGYLCNFSFPTWPWSQTSWYHLVTGRVTVIVIDRCVPAKQSGKSWPCDPFTSFQKRAKAMVEAFYYSLRAFMSVQKF